MLNENIKAVRKSKGLSQEELAIKLNVVRQTISKWERGESLPDIIILCQLADIFGITINELCYQNQTNIGEIKSKSAKHKHLYISILGTGLVWLVTTIVFAMFLAFAPEMSKKWLCFVVAIPVSGIVLVVFNSLWGKRIYNAIFVSVIFWGILFALCLSVNLTNINWLYLIGIPLELLTVIWYCFKPEKNRKN